MKGTPECTHLLKSKPWLARKSMDPACTAPTGDASIHCATNHHLTQSADMPFQFVLFVILRHHQHWLSSRVGPWQTWHMKRLSWPYRLGAGNTKKLKVRAL